MKIPGKQSNHNILYLSYDGVTDSLGQSQILPYLTGLADEGYSITLISFEKQERDKQHRYEVQKICDNHNLRWIPLKYHKSPLVLSTVYDLLTLKRVVKKLYKENQFSIIHCRSYLTSLIGLWAKRKFSGKFIFDMRGFWVDERIDGGLWNMHNPLFNFIFKFFKAKEKQFIKEADHIISLTENARQEILSWGLTQAPISVIPTCVDMDLFHPGKNLIETETARKALSIEPDNFILVYLGSWGTWYMTDDILQFFSILVSKNLKATLLILTPDQPDLTKYEFASRVIVRNVTRKEVPVFLNLGNATICFIKPGFSKKASSATKMAESWAMNLPVVTNPGWGDIDRLKESGFPLLVCDSKSEYHRIASLLINDIPKYKREMLLGKFDLLSGIQKYKSIYHALSVI